MRLGGFCVSVFLAANLLVPIGLTGEAGAAVVSNWDKSSRSWNNSHMTRIKTTMQDSGHRVLGDTSISLGSLKGAGVFVMGEPIATPTASELTLLRQFVRDGGFVFIFADTGIDLSTYNNVLSGIGSTITFTPTTIGTSTALPIGQFTQSPWKIWGNSLNVSSGNGTAGGTLIDNNYVRFEALGPGYVFVFGDRIDHNDVISDTNTQLLLNIVSAAGGSADPIPGLSQIGLLLAALLLAGLGAREFTRRPR